MSRFSSTKLLFNHIDAWVVSMAVVVAALTVHDEMSLKTLPIMIAFGLAYWLAFAVNDYFDAPSDAVDRSKAAGNYFTVEGASSRGFWLIAVVLSVLIVLVFGRYGWVGAIIMGIGAFIAWSYSAPPIRLKERPGIDVVTHAVFVESFPYAAVVLIMGAAWTALDVFILGVLFLGSLSAQLEQQLRDFDLDMLTGNTFATAAGRGRTHALLVLATIALLGGAAYYYLRGDVPLYLVPFGLIPLPALLHRLIRGPGKSRSPALVAVTATVALTYMTWLIAHQMLLVQTP